MSTEHNNIKHQMAFQSQSDTQVPFSFQQMIGKVSPLKTFLKKEEKERKKVGGGALGRGLWTGRPIKINGMIWFCLALLLQESHLNGSHYKLDSRSKDNYCGGGSNGSELCRPDQRETLNCGPRKHVSLRLRLHQTN